ncbi:hypothetical protein MHYP_G00194330 [Metynnis hypsauchen]
MRLKIFQKKPKKDKDDGNRVRLAEPGEMVCDHESVLYTTSGFLKCQEVYTDRLHRSTGMDAAQWSPQARNRSFPEAAPLALFTPHFNVLKHLWPIKSLSN